MLSQLRFSNKILLINLRFPHGLAHMRECQAVPRFIVRFGIIFARFVEAPRRCQIITFARFVGVPWVVLRFGVIFVRFVAVPRFVVRFGIILARFVAVPRRCQIIILVRFVGVRDLVSYLCEYLWSQGQCGCGCVRGGARRTAFLK